MMKNIKLLLLAFISCTMITSCIVDDEPDNSFAEGNFFVGFSEKLAAVSYFADEGVVLKNYPVKLLGGSDGSLPTQDITISYIIDPSSTAVEGQEFDFVSNTGTLVLPAGAKFVNFPLDVNTGNFDANLPTTLVLKLTGTSVDGTVVSALNDKLTITFVGCLSDAADYTYQVQYKNETSGATANLGIQSLFTEGINGFRTLTTGGFSAGGNGEPANESGVSFSVLCGDINIPTQGLFQGFFSNEVKQIEPTSVDPITGDFVLKYNVVTGPSSNADYTMTYTKQ